MSETGSFRHRQLGGAERMAREVRSARASPGEFDPSRVDFDQINRRIAGEALKLLEA